MKRENLECEVHQGNSPPELCRHRSNFGRTHFLTLPMTDMADSEKSLLSLPTLNPSPKPQLFLNTLQQSIV